MSQEFRETGTASQALSTGDREYFGRRLRTLRLKAGLSIRQISARAGIDKNTVLRIEAGEPVRQQSLLRLCNSFGILGLPLSAHTQPRLEGEHFVVHQREKEAWFRLQLKEAQDPSKILESVDLMDPRERHRLGSLGFASQFVKRLGVDRPEGVLRAAIFEVYGSSGWSAQSSGEAFVYALRGDLRFTIEEEQFDLRESEGATFDRTRQHMHEPLNRVGPKDLPPLLLYVQSD